MSVRVGRFWKKRALDGLFHLYRIRARYVALGHVPVVYPHLAYRARPNKPLMPWSTQRAPLYYITDIIRIERVSRP
ncbi:hypothetical protein Hsw_PA0226 (plasmid) [Hymenobacter swuensis DY53]|uniref:Uncharacterized protein n=1 Tax=Hymenobacter swuensis DY53 TaxID=1227739 RepID=W8EQZ1_9BACT|nr:hypothetical protein Hsw_PA0226 [Hymenobacter swuensis DY53]